LKEFDFIIVGAGPAGATAARVLGQSGSRVLLIDKSRFPRDKPCGGGISARLTKRFPYLKAELNRIPVNWVRRVHLESPAGRVVQYISEEPLYLMIRRYEFDNLLYDLAAPYVELTQGLVRNLIRESNRVVVATDNAQEFAAKMVIAADGANSFIARASGLKQGNVHTQYAIDMMEETPYADLNVAEHKTMYVYYGIQGHYGYGWIFPKCNHINLGVGFKLDHYIGKMSGTHYDHHASFIEHLKAKGTVQGMSDRNAFHAFPIPITGPLPRTYTDRVVLCGDAGSFVNAFTAEGIYYAMVSGEHAANVALESLARDDFSSNQLRTYEAAWKAEIGLELEKSFKIQRVLLSDTTRIDRIVKAASRDKGLAHLLAQYATGGISYPDFKRSMIFRAFPTYVWEKTKQWIRWGNVDEH
jgi:geranylgeranyl reductase family protein